MLSHYLKAALTVLREEGVAELHRETNAFVDRASQRLEFECNTSNNALMNRIRYDAPPSAESPIEVDPHRITRRKEGFSADKVGLGKIKNGDWDREAALDPITADRTVEGVRQRFEDEKSWEETVYYDKFKSKYYGNESRVRERCEYVDYLYDDISENGYKPASEADNKRDRSGYGQYLEVLVVIDRDGNIHHQGKGSHRLGIAKVLDIDITVQVLVRHTQWQALRDEVNDAGLSEEHNEELREHPDLQDVLE